MPEIPPFARRFFDPEQRLFRIGGGAVGGKAMGLLRASEVLARRGGEIAAAGIAVDVPSLVVLGTDLFDRFVASNGLDRLLAGGDVSDGRIADAFLAASIPPELVGDLRSLAELVKVPDRKSVV